MLNKDLLKELKKTIYEINKPSHINNKKSSNKVDTLHFAVHRHLSLLIDEGEFIIWSKHINKREYKTQGFYFQKNSDIVILKRSTNQPIATIEFKMPLSSVQKNTNNAISNMIGEASNIQLNNIKTFWIYCVREVTPVFDKHGNIKSVYKFNPTKFIKVYEKNFPENKSIPRGLSLNIYKDNLDLENFSEERDIGINLDKIYKNDSLIVEYSENSIINLNGLFLNDYEKFIQYIVKEVKNEK